MEDTEATVRQTYTYPLLSGAPKILNYNEDIRNFNLEEAVRTIAKKWEGIPLKGTAQDELLEDFKEAGISDKKRKLVSSFRTCCTILSNYNIALESHKATREDLKKWPQYLSKIKEEYRVIANLEQKP